ncbi:hypothetical protein ATK36_5039 [Amycolatopsis sulphurea]|uniref:Uncharacterized protein n=1 Tax=Amycolatopsis sulphurea TaxID=76022 RepID=A0A2A9FGH9_9PSEU|nr:hypothetical protein ATK36_5039 [Amycolatopsis sulphurea]
MDDAAATAPSADHGSSTDVAGDADQLAPGRRTRHAPARRPRALCAPGQEHLLPVRTASAHIPAPHHERDPPSARTDRSAGGSPADGPAPSHDGECTTSPPHTPPRARTDKPPADDGESATSPPHLTNSNPGENGQARHEPPDPPITTASPQPRRPAPRTPPPARTGQVTSRRPAPPSRQHARNLAASDPTNRRIQHTAPRHDGECTTSPPCITNSTPPSTPWRARVRR